ncbi:MAG: CZB domain-containing protein [Gammaproteobacteria bacterium]
MGIESDIEHFIHAHGEWKTRFRDFLNGKAGLDLSTVGQTNACTLGQWLDGSAQRTLSDDDHAEACRLHAHFHQVAGGIVHAIKQKDFQAARAALAPSGSFDQASHALGAFLRKIAHHAPKAKSPKVQAAEVPQPPAADAPPAGNNA